MGGTCAEFSSVRKFGSAKNSRSFDPAPLAVWLAGLLGGSAGCCALGACPDDGVALGAADCGSCAGVCCTDCCGGAGNGISACGRAKLLGAMASSAAASEAESATKGRRHLVVI